jgi:hypothetical protein
MPMLLAEVTRAWEVAAAAEAARSMAMLAVETLAREASAAWNIVAFHVKDAEDRAFLVVREVLERMSRVETENAVPLAFAHEDAECLIQKIVLLEGLLAAVRKPQEVSERECRE